MTLLEAAKAYREAEIERSKLERIWNQQSTDRTALDQDLRQATKVLEACAEQVLILAAKESQ